MTRSIRLGLLASVLFSLAASHSEAANQVFTVGAIGSHDFSVLQDAVNAAADGDLLLLDYAQYVDTVIDGKSLTLIGDPDAIMRPQVHRLVIKNLAAGQKVVVRGIDSMSALFFSFHQLEITNCAGPVLFEDCGLAPTGIVTVPPGATSLVAVTNSDRVTFTRSTLASWQTLSDLLSAAALQIHSSTVALYDCTVTGSRGADAFKPIAFSGPIPSTAGGDAIQLVSGSLFLAGCTVTGGAGGNGAFLDATCFPPSSGGDGIEVGGLLRRMDTTIAGGAAGVPASGCAPGGSAGTALVIGPGGNVLTIADTLRRYDVDSPVAENGLITHTIQGVAGEPVLMLIGFSPDGTYVPGLRGALIPGAPLTAIFLGVLPPGGTLSFQLAAPILPAGIEGVEVYEQCAVPGVTGSGLLTTPSVVVLLDDAI